MTVAIYIYPPPLLHPSISPSLISLMVFVDVKHHVYLLISGEKLSKIPKLSLKFVGKHTFGVIARSICLESADGHRGSTLSAPVTALSILH